MEDSFTNLLETYWTRRGGRFWTSRFGSTTGDIRGSLSLPVYVVLLERLTFLNLAHLLHCFFFQILPTTYCTVPSWIAHTRNMPKRPLLILVTRASESCGESITHNNAPQHKPNCTFWYILLSAVPNTSSCYVTNRNFVYKSRRGSDICKSIDLLFKLESYGASYGACAKA